MSFPPPAVQISLHRRVLDEDPLSSFDVFQYFVPELTRFLLKNRAIDDDIAYDSAIDAIFTYIRKPRVFDPKRARLSTFLVEIARKRAIDRLRSRAARLTREKKFAVDVDMFRPDPKNEMESEIDARSLWRRVQQVLPDAHDQECAKELMKGEGDTEKLAAVLGLGRMPITEKRREVKRQRDRILRTLERMGSKLRK
jgi:RNA polymerase sigma-70 factor (ECF subfamily)